MVRNGYYPESFSPRSSGSFTNEVQCSYLEEDGCSIPENDRPSECGEFKCELFLLAEQDRRVSKYCPEFGFLIITDLWHLAFYKVYCKSSCPNICSCAVSERITLTEEQATLIELLSDDQAEAIREMALIA